jgi:hypothetical protein
MALTLASATAGTCSQARRVSSPGCPSRWPRRILEAVMVASPMPSPTNRITLRATGRADPVLPSTDNRRRKAALASSYQKSRSVDKNRAFQHNETNVMHFSFSSLRIKTLYMFRALLVHPQEAFHKRHLVYWCVLCQLSMPRLRFYCNRGTANWHHMHTIYQVPFV